MDREKLIVKQQLEIEHYKSQAKANARLKKVLIGKCYNIGQPLNDNILQFNPKQQKWVWDVVQLVESLDFSENENG